MIYEHLSDSVRANLIRAAVADKLRYELRNYINNTLEKVRKLADFDSSNYQPTITLVDIRKNLAAIAEYQHALENLDEFINNTHVC